MEALTQPHEREVRVRLTTRCNYACFFCHEEGGGTGCETASFAEFRPLLERLVAEGRRDFTFTGGEPLLNKPALVEALQWIAKHPARPAVTLITNGALMDDTVADALAGCCKAKIHLSLHAADRATYFDITGQRQTDPAELKGRFKRLTARGIGLKVNAVILRDLAENDTRLEGLVSFARETGASHVKLIEMLVTEEHPELAEHFLPLEAVEARVMVRANPVSLSERTHVYRWKDNGPLVELTRCACRLGCSVCEHFRADFFTGGPRYRPCFLSSLTCRVTADTLTQTLEHGRRMIRGRAKRYGTRAPLLAAGTAL